VFTVPYWTNPKIEDSAPYQTIQWFNNLEDTILATDYWDRAGSKRNQAFPPLGAIREENAWLGGGVYKNVSVDGKARFMWVWNNSGSDIAKGVPMVKRAAVTVSNIDSGSVNTAVKAATFTANKEIGGLVTVLDDQSPGSGAAPEGEYGKIYWNDVTTIKFQPDFTAALAINDDLIIQYMAHVLAAGSGAELSDFRGVPVASGGILNGYMGWACIEADAVDILIAAIAATVTIDKGLIATTAAFTEGSSAAVPTVLAYALQGMKADTVNRHILASLASNKMRGASA
jgi:hypothetical protein